MALVNLQTTDGSFMLSPDLAALLGISFADMEAGLRRFVPQSNISLNEAQTRRMWATVLAIELFETRMAGERGVWGLVVDKAKAWVKEQALFGDENIKELERLAGEVLGV
jgi:hypothetical protein